MYGMRDASISDSTLEPESHIQGTSMSSVASTSIRRGRVRSKNISPTKQTNDTNQKLRIEISEGLSRLVGKIWLQCCTPVEAHTKGLYSIDRGWDMQTSVGCKSRICSRSWAWRDGPSILFVRPLQ